MVIIALSVASCSRLCGPGDSSVKPAAANRGRDLLNVIGERTVARQAWRVTADLFVSQTDAEAGLERPAILQAFGGGEQLDGDDVFDVLDDLTQLRRRRHAHRDVVFFVGRGRQIVSRRRVSQHFAFVEQGDGSDLRDHKAG